MIIIVFVLIYWVSRRLAKNELLLVILAVYILNYL